MNEFIGGKVGKVAMTSDFRVMLVAVPVVTTNIKVVGTGNAISRTSRGRSPRTPRCAAIVATTSDFRTMLAAAPVVITINKVRFCEITWNSEITKNNDMTQAGDNFGY